MFVKLFFISLLLHIIDDFVLQPVCLSKLKQKSFWKENAPDEMYKNDYITALCMHGMSWAIMIMMPYMFFINASEWMFVAIFAVNASVHAYVDHLKANKHKLNLENDQFIHMIQLLMTNIVFMLF